jgi:hypothetical protein
LQVVIASMNIGRAALPLLVAVLVGCARHEGLAPATDALVPLGHPNQAFAAEQGVRIFIDGDAWRGAPRDLARQLTVVWLRIENRGGLPIRLMYHDFKLVSSTHVLAPLPPFAVGTPGATDNAPQIVPSRAGFAARGFYLLPFYRPYYPGAQVWGGSSPFNPTFYRRRRLLWQAPLPSRDMAFKALPEGVLVPGGSVSGFLYFPPLPPEDRGTVAFWASLPSVTDGTRFVNIKIGLRRR